MAESFMLLLVVLGGYLLGSIPSGLVLTRAAGKGDIRDIGSGNIGTTNVLRTGSKRLAALTLLADIGKGVLTVYLANALVGGTATYLAALACFCGHVFPVWLGFKGGKGVATFIGLILALSPLPGLAFLLVWLLTALVGRRSSLAAIVALLVTPFFLWFLGEYDTARIFAVMVLIALWAHRENIARLRAGTEPRIGSAA